MGWVRSAKRISCRVWGTSIVMRFCVYVFFWAESCFIHLWRGVTLLGWFTIFFFPLFLLYSLFIYCSTKHILQSLRFLFVYFHIKNCSSSSLSHNMYTVAPWEFCISALRWWGRAGVRMQAGPPARSHQHVCSPPAEQWQCPINVLQAIWLPSVPFFPQIRSPT